MEPETNAILNYNNNEPAIRIIRNSITLDWINSFLFFLQERTDPALTNDNNRIRDYPGNCVIGRECDR